MGLNNKNRGGVNWGVETKDWEFKKLRELEEGKQYKLLGCFVSPDHGYGEGAVFISDGFLVNIPARYISLVTDIQSDHEAIEEIKSGKGAFKYHKFKSAKYNRDAFSVEVMTI